MRKAKGVGGRSWPSAPAVFWGLGLAAGMLAVAVTPTDVRGQGVRGRVVDSTSGLVVPEANVRLIANDGRIVAEARSDGQGLYRIVARDEGWYQVEIRRVGYRPLLAGPFRLRSRAELGLELRVVAVAVELDPVEVTERGVPLRNAALAQVGFYDRQRSDFGRFITRDEIDKRQARQFTELLGMVPGVRLVPGVGGPGRYGVQLRGSRLSDGGLCRPRVYIDGLMMLRGDAGPRRLQRESSGNPLATEFAADNVELDEIALDDLAIPSDIEAIEVYRSSSQVPARFGGTGAETQCGVIVVWTRRGGAS